MSEQELIIQNLKGELARRNKTQSEIARALNISEKTMSLKLAGKSPFDTEQLGKIAQALNLTLYQLMIVLLQPLSPITAIKGE